MNLIVFFFATMLNDNKWKIQNVQKQIRLRNTLYKGSFLTPERF